VYDIAKELGIETAEALAKLNELGEYVKSGSSTIAPPVANKLRAAYPTAKPKEEAPKVEKAPAKPKATKASAKSAEVTEEVKPADPEAPAEASAPEAPVAPTPGIPRP
jgi:translation initiation factor IF-2